MEYVLRLDSPTSDFSGKHDAYVQGRFEEYIAQKESGKNTSGFRMPKINLDGHIVPKEEKKKTMEDRLNEIFKERDTVEEKYLKGGALNVYRL